MLIKSTALSRLFSLVLLAIGIFGLYANASQAEEVLQIAAKDVKAKGCQLISTISADSGYGKKNDWRREAKSKALTKAKALGASAVVWDRFVANGSFNGLIEGKAYNCKELDTQLANGNPEESNGLVRK